MPKHRHPIHPHGEYWLHGDGRPRPVRVLEIGTPDRKAGKVHVYDGRTRYWVPRRALSRSAKPAPQRRPEVDALVAAGIAARRGRR